MNNKKNSQHKKIAIDWDIRMTEEEIGNLLEKWKKYNNIMPCGKWVKFNGQKLRTGDLVWFKNSGLAFVDSSVSTEEPNRFTSIPELWSFGGDVCINKRKYDKWGSSHVKKSGWVYRNKQWITDSSPAKWDKIMYVMHICRPEGITNISKQKEKKMVKPEKEYDCPPCFYISQLKKILHMDAIKILRILKQEKIGKVKCVPLTETNSITPDLWSIIAPTWRSENFIPEGTDCYFAEEVYKKIINKPKEYFKKPYIRIDHRKESRKELKKSFLMKYKEIQRVGDALDITGISYTTYYRWQDEDKIFGEEVKKIKTGIKLLKAQRRKK